MQPCGVKEENMVTAALPEHDKISSLTLFAKVEYGAKIIACAHLLLFLETLSVWLVLK